MTDAPPIGDTTSPPPFANEVPNSVTTTVPADGTSVATSAENADQVSEEQDEKLGEIDVPDIIPTGIAPADVRQLNELQTQITLVAEADSIKDYDEKVDKRLAELNARALELEHSGYPGKEAEGRALSDEIGNLGFYAEKIYEVLHRHPFDPEATKASFVGYAAAAHASAARHKRKIPHKRDRKRPKHVTVLARSVRNHVAAGSYTVTLHLSRVQLKRLLGKKKKLTIYITVFMRVPHKGIKGGMPIVSAKAVTLKRR
jgi:hypothetical protein